MKTFWIYTTIIFATAFAVTLMLFLNQKPQTIINCETYIESQKNEIAKIKQKKSDGSTQEVKQKSVLSKIFGKKEI